MIALVIGGSGSGKILPRNPEKCGFRSKVAGERADKPGRGIVSCAC